MFNPLDDEAMLAYYSERATSYDAMYRDITPDYRSPLLDDLQQAVAGRRVLDLACGTGFWSEWVARSADFVLGVDIAPPMLALARARPLPPGKAEFIAGSVYSLDGVPASFTAAIAMQWFSHVPQANYGDFFSAMHSRLLPGGSVFLADNIRQPNETDPLFQKPGAADTYELRTLADGTRHEIIKNYFSAEQLAALVPAEVEPASLSIRFGKTWWWMNYRLR
jgi:2-polyprenyl-3-methyl-5-hydroxy-6-metoxy-1,4-benzoquinol methylase